MSNSPNNAPAPPPAPVVTAPLAAPAVPPAPATAPKRNPALLIVSAALLVGWFGWLSYTALTKSRAPVVSHAQAAGAKVPVRGTLTTGHKDLRATHQFADERNLQIQNLLRGEDNKPSFVVTVTEQLHPTGPAVGAKIGVRNLPDAGGYTGPGDYLLLLVRDGDATIDGAPSYVLVGVPKSPGSDTGDGGAPVLYPWTDKHADDLRKQVKRLFP